MQKWQKSPSRQPHYDYIYKILSNTVKIKLTKQKEKDTKDKHYLNPSQDKPKLNIKNRLLILRFLWILNTIIPYFYIN